MLVGGLPVCGLVGSLAGLSDYLARSKNKLIHIYAHTYTCIHVYTYIYIYICMCICLIQHNSAIMYIKALLAVRLALWSMFARVSVSGLLVRYRASSRERVLKRQSNELHATVRVTLLSG